MKPDTAIIILVDTREQAPYRFEGWHVEAATLATADYSVFGLTEYVAVERKELSDFLACCGRERDRFKGELNRLRAYRWRAVVVEADMNTLRAGRYRSQIDPAAAVGTLASWALRYQVPFFLAGDRAGGEALTLAMLRAAWRQAGELAAPFIAAPGVGARGGTVAPLPNPYPRALGLTVAAGEATPL